MKKEIMIFYLGVIFILSGCADSISFEAAQSTIEVGFWYGLWHGVILPISWIVSLFSENTAIYAIYNNGGWYDLGYFLGIGVLMSRTKSF